jgi:L-asparaginase
MKERQGVLQPPESAEDLLKTAPGLQDMVDLEFVSLLNKDSTDMNPDDWISMANAVNERRFNGYDGFVIAHGTDTMHFSATAVAFAFGKNLSFPIVFTGAQTSSNVQLGDAKANLVRACKVASEDLAEVVVCFDQYIFRGCRCQKKEDQRFDAFESPGFGPIGYIDASIEITPHAKRRDPNLGIIDYQPFFERGILLVNMIPGLEPNLIDSIVEQEKCKGLILQSFGAGNVPKWKEFSFVPLIKRATEMGKPVVIASQFPRRSAEGTRFLSGLDTCRAGAILAGNMTSAAAVVKFRWALAQVAKLGLDPSRRVQEFGAIMQRPYVGEMDWC